MNLSEKAFRVLDTLDSREITTQRELAEHAGISLGQVNYVLKNLLEKGLVKIGNFRKNPRKIGYVYNLTPKGLEARSALAARFVMSRLREYHRLRDRLAERLDIIGTNGGFRIFFVGPSIVARLLDSIIEEKKMSITLVGQCSDLNDLKDYDQEFFDVVILFDRVAGGQERMEEAEGVSRDKIVLLW
jgi:EPS-associated MarR family transcriptional regulator